jgi:hypothetical protein
MTYEPILTAAWHGRVLLDRNTDFAAINMRFSQNDRALVIEWKTRKKYTMAWILTSCGLSIALGVMVGLACHDAGLGVAVGAGAAAVVGVVSPVLMRPAK